MYHHFSSVILFESYRPDIYTETHNHTDTHVTADRLLYAATKVVWSARVFICVLFEQFVASSRD